MTTLQPVEGWARTAETPDLAKIAFTAEGMPPAVRPGQYVEVETPGGRGFFALGPRAGAQFTLLVKRQSEGAASWFWTTAPGAPWRASVPLGGGFLLEGVGRGTRVLVCATGSGIAPVPPLLDALEERGAVVTLLYGVRGSADVAFGADLEARRERGALGLLDIRVSAATGQALPRFGRAGRVTDAVPGALSHVEHTVVFLCGHPDMVRDVTALAAARGVPADNIRLNY